MRRLALVFVLATAVWILPAASPPAAVTTPTAATGVTGIALDSRVELAWQPVAGASGYTVYRGTTATSINTLLTGAGGVAGTTFTDSTASNNTTYYYAVRSVAGGVESANSNTVAAAPVARACSTGNAVVLENCYPGNSGWDVRNTATVPSGGIEGYATAASINKGQSVDLKVNSDDNSTFRIEIFRSGYYGGAGARLFSTIRGVRGVRQPGCLTDSTTGLIDCSNWGVSATLTTTASWPSGIYLLRITREDTGNDNQILLAVRDDSSHSALLYGTAFSNFEAYNNYGGKSLYDFNSFGGTTVAGTARAVKVSLDRPFEQPRSGLRDWYTRTEFATVYWLEQSGYPVSYASNTDLERSGALVQNHHAYISSAHDEYYSAGMRSALESARAAGVNLFFSGSNEVYWKIRYEDNPNTGGTDRVEVCYKSTQSGPPDPSGIPTGTWRDPAGANNPENALSGEMYVGDNDSVYFPFTVSAAQGTDRLYRFTALSAQPPGGSTTFGSSLSGWEWDARVNNGREPAGVKTLSSTAVTGELIQNFGANTIPGSTNTSMVKYTAASGALVVTTGTNHWNRGLARNASGVGEPDTRIQQVTTNIFEDMGALPETPAPDITLDNPLNRPPAPTGTSAVALGTDSVRITWNAVAGASGYNVYRALAPRDGGQPLGALANGTIVSGTAFTDIGLAAATDYYYVVTAVVAGVQSPASNEAHATTAASAGVPTRINAGGGAYTALSGATFRADGLFTGGSTFAAPNRAISGTTDPALYRDERWGQFSYAIPVTAGTYDVRFHFVELYYGTSVPGGPGSRVFGMDILDTTGQDLSNIDIYSAVGPNAALVRTVSNVSVTDGTLNIRSVYGSADDPEVAAIEVIPQAVSNPPPTVVDTQPLDGDTGDSLLTEPRAVFSRAMDPATITASSFTLATSGGTPVPATVSYDSATNSATLSPTSSLAFSTTYRATIASTVAAADGTRMSAPFSWTFTTTAPIPPTVTSKTPADGATGVSPTVHPSAAFSRSLDPATVTSSSFTLRASDGTGVPATVAYDDAFRTATLTPTAPLNLDTIYTATLDTTIKATDGVALASPVSWSFRTPPAPPPPPSVTTTPTDGATGIARSATPTATFSRDMDASTISDTSFTLSSGGTPVQATVTYDQTTHLARLTPSAPLAYSATYTATLASTIRAADQTPINGPVSWSFTTLDQPPPPVVTTTAPADGASYAARSSSVQATFSVPMDPATLTTTTFTLQDANGAAVPAAVSYDANTRTASLTPSALLAGGSGFTATITTGARSTDGVAITTPKQWAFSTAACPCSLFSVLAQPSQQNITTQDGRSGTGPWSYELGVKVRVDEPMQLTALRFYKSALETGTHTGTVWSSSGTVFARTTFATETASGWQTQQLASPVSLAPGAVYYVSVNANAYFGDTPGGLQTQVIAGPLRSVADGANGVYGSAAGQFPTQSFNSTNYYVDLEVVPDGDPAPPGVTSTDPAANATGVSRTATVNGTFSRPMNPSTLTTSTFTLTGPGGTVPATVTYNDATTTATLTPSAPLAYSTTYTARVSTGARAQDGKTLAAPASWTFTTAGAVGPQVTSTLPTAGVADVGPTVKPRATFSKSLVPSTINSGTYTLTGPSGAVTGTVTYDDSTRTATFTPSAPLVNGSYTARLDGSVASTDGGTLGTAYSWSFGVTSGLAAASVTGRTPADGSVYISRDRTPTATFSRSMDPATLSGAFSLTDPNGNVVSATATYDAATLTATFAPATLLAPTTVYTARVDTTAKAADGTALGATATWSFTTAACPCSLFSPTAAPATTGLPTQDGRSGSGPWSYELGTKVTLDEPMQLSAVRFYKDVRETGAHMARVWTGGGTLLAQATFTNETASGWQRQALGTPLTLSANTTYVVSVNANSFFGVTTSGLLSQVVSGPLRSVADGANGVYGSAAGVFPSQSYSSSNYFVDGVFTPDASVGPPTATSTGPANGATGIARSTSVTATFSRSMDPTTISGQTVTLTGPAGPVTGTVSWLDSSRTAVLTPGSPLALSTTYTATITTGARARDGQPLASPVTWSFRTADPVAPQVVSTVPAANATDIGATVQPRATFSKSLDPATVTSSTYTLTGPAGAVPASVGYDDSTKTATLTPNASLAAGLYTARLDGSITASDGSPLGTAYSWSFTVGSSLPPFAVSSTVPAAGATGVTRDVKVQATFNRSADPATVTGANFTLTGPAGAVGATVSYDDTTKTATLTPSAVLGASTTYTANVLAGIHAADGSPIAPQSWTFTTGSCPCSLFAPTLLPARTGNPVRDGRPAPGPWSRELGVKFTVDQPMTLTAIRFYKDTRENGSHTGTIWTSNGVALATAAYTGETASGWQQANLATPLTLQPNVVYVASVGFNANYVFTGAGLAAQIVSGPLRSVADGNNGVYSAAAGIFPTSSFNSSNYFVDVVVR